MHSSMPAHYFFSTTDTAELLSAYNLIEFQVLILHDVHSSSTRYDALKIASLIFNFLAICSSFTISIFHNLRSFTLNSFSINAVSCP